MTHAGAVQWGFVVLVSAGIAAACSDPVGVKGPNGERLDTQVSATSVKVGDSVEVAVVVSNPAGQTLTLVYGSQVTYAQATQGDGTFGGGLITLAPTDIILPPGVETSLKPVMVHILAAGVYEKPAEGSEQLPLMPGVYNLAACAWASRGNTPGGVAWVPSCGQNITFTVTQ